MAKIHVLSADEARKIAAGEVIDRGASLVREFIDNALDSGAANIEVSIEDGGSRLVEVWDDGSGMEEEDLLICTVNHATSKVRTLDDLLTLATLGFRGEALTAASAVSRLEIISSTDGHEAYLYTAGENGAQGKLEKAVRVKGTTVRARYLFDNIPARKSFLKRSSSEGLLCKQVFLDKAAAHPQVSFRYREDGNLKITLPAQDLKSRFANCFGLQKEERLLYTINTAGNGWNAKIVAGAPGVSRGDRRLQFVFANRRKLDDWQLKHAFESGLAGGFPNSEHPVGAVFLEVDPSLVDFNIHPAKREAKFKTAADIHHGIHVALREFLHTYLAKERYSMMSSMNDGDVNLSFSGEGGGEFDEGHTNYNYDFLSDTAFGSLTNAALESLANAALDDEGAASSTESERHEGTKFVGRLMDVFILVEKDEKLFIVDQHAAHERILYDACMSHRIKSERLLVPIIFETDTEETEEFLCNNCAALEELGLVLARECAHSWQIDALPEGWKADDATTIESVLALPQSGTRFLEDWAASLACHAAVKDGSYLDDKTALQMAEAALALPVSRCPHGRPIFVEMTKTSLFKGVRRM